MNQFTTSARTQKYGEEAILNEAEEIGCVWIEQRCADAGGVYPGSAMYTVAIGNAVIVDYLSGWILFQDLSYLRIAQEPVSAWWSFSFLNRRVRGWVVEFRNRSRVILLWISSCIRRGGVVEFFGWAVNYYYYNPALDSLSASVQCFCARCWGV